MPDARTARSRTRRLAALPAVAALLAVPTLAASPTAGALPVPTLSVAAGNGTPGPATNGANATATGIGYAQYGVAVDSHGDTFVPDDYNLRVYEITPDGTIRTYAGNGTNAPVTPGPATASSVGDPFGLAIDAAGDLYIADAYNYVVEKVTPGGTISVVAGNGGHGPTSAGKATSEPIGGIEGLAVDAAGDLFMASYEHDQLYEVDPSGNLTVIAGLNGQDVKATPGPATATPIGLPNGVVVDGAGNVFMTNDYNYVYKITPGGTLSVVAGDGTSHRPAEGAPAATSPIGHPEGITIDAAGDLFVSDDLNELVYEITPAGSVHTYAGTGDTTRPAATPGPATATPIGQPEAIALDRTTGDLVVTDVQNYYLYRIAPSAPSVDGGYRLAGADGSVFAFGSASFNGSATGFPHAPVVATAATPDGHGYWLAAADGGVFTYGTAGFYGSAGGVHLNAPIVAMVPSVDGGGYWLVGADGGVFAYGDAGFHGSAVGLGLHAPVVAAAASPSGGGYTLAARDGGVFSFGDASFHGSAVSAGSTTSYTGIAATRTGGGYWLAGSNGTVVAFGDATLHGQPAGLAAPVVGIADSGDDGGYLLVAADGGVFAYGDAAFHGSAVGLPRSAPIVGFGLTP